MGRTRGISKLLVRNDVSFTLAGACRRDNDDLCPKTLETTTATAPSVNTMPIGRGESTRRAAGSAFRVPPGASPLRICHATSPTPGSSEGLLSTVDVPLIVLI